MNNVIIQYNQMEYLFDQRLSLKAKGVMAIMVAHVNKNQAKNINFKLDDIRQFTADGVSAFNNAVSQLKQYGYLRQEMVGNGHTEAVWEYILKE